MSTGSELDILLEESRCLIMGVVNVTPDSFSDGGLYLNAEQAVAHGLSLVEAGADILDVGGESSRPAGAVYGVGAKPVSVEEEKRRVIPVIQALAERSDVPISIDTTKSMVAREALSAGASIVNDISGLKMDSAMAGVVAEHGCTVVIMHMRGTPQTTNTFAHYPGLVTDIVQELEERAQYAIQEGVSASSIIVDPGIGFGKSADENLELIRRIPDLKKMGYPVLIGVSRKSFIGTVLGGVPVEEREWGSAAAVAASALSGADIVRVHDVEAMYDVVRVANAIRHEGVPCDIGVA